MSVLLHAVPLAGVCRKERSSAVPPVRAGPEEMRCVGSKRTPELGRDMLLAASIVKLGPWGKSHCAFAKKPANMKKMRTKCYSEKANAAPPGKRKRRKSHARSTVPGRGGFCHPHTGTHYTICPQRE